MVVLHSKPLTVMGGGVATSFLHKRPRRHRREYPVERRRNQLCTKPPSRLYIQTFCICVYNLCLSHRVEICQNFRPIFGSTLRRTKFRPQPGVHALQPPLEGHERILAYSKLDVDG